MSASGRPMRFLGWLLGGWVVARTGLLVAPLVWGTLAAGWSEWPWLGGTPRIVHVMLSLKAPSDEERAGLASPSPLRSRRRSSPGSRAGQIHAPAANQRRNLVPAEAPHFAAALLEEMHGEGGSAWGAVDPEPELAPAVALATNPVAPPMTGGHRWSGTAWLLWRPEMAGSALSAPLLGGSQAGARLDYRLHDGSVGQVALYLRASRAFAGPSSEEAALGLGWRPANGPVSLMAERRQKLGPGGRSAFALITAGGFGPRAVAPRLEAEGYAQAGVVGLDDPDAFADGKASLFYVLAQEERAFRLVAGASVSGSAQPGAARLDLGPEISLRVPTGAGTMRVSGEWRLRIGGEARPASGPAITLVADF
ncbi:hypothetical protein SLG_31590 [Sphingobium sp. SYK-6]|uniref:hypothetical protein n=1 Tax=Sphingobium sp. (strain NBRC 103272 / SYK-6) TaxID=627192 RepID=UPI0002277622|nr:hypothetical protein [Sphingobium sp. SYK-6]BAK67834.1 hypothetical protein SLG_31590 [Sphingobium sp. SYK-6]